MSARPQLMIPGPVEISPAVLAATGAPPPSHLAPAFVEQFQAALGQMRQVWQAKPDAQPFVVAGSGTLAMDMAAVNLLGPQDAAVVVETGFFSRRTADGLRRTGAKVTMVSAPAGEVPPAEEVAAALEATGAKALFFTHVDTSTGVLVDPEPMCAAARDLGALVVADGVCAAGAETFHMGALGADVYLTGSQKALGLPAGLALLVASPRALDVRRSLSHLPPLYLDWLQWLPILNAYEAGSGKYFATPPTTLVGALTVALDEILTDDIPGKGPAHKHGIEARVHRHRVAAEAIRAGCRALGLGLVPKSDEIAAHTLTAVRFPEEVGPELVGAIKARGVVVAGGLHPELGNTYFRVGHMGWVTTQPERLLTTVRAIGDALGDVGQDVDPGAGVAAAKARLDEG